MDSRRRSIASVSTGYGPLAVIPPPTRSVTPMPRRPTLRSERLAMRLRSNTGLTFHTNEAALDRYINYQNSGPLRPPSSTSAPQHQQQHQHHQHDALYEEEGGADPADMDPGCSPGEGPTAAELGLQSLMPFLDFLGQSAFQMSLDNPAISRQLLRYCEDHGCQENIEFLMKIQEYNQATDEIASVLTGIATSFTSPGAKNPLSLPPMLARQLNADIKRVAHTILPGMESIFGDATRHVKKHIAREAFPGFVQTQFTHCVSAALASGTHGIGSPKLEYPGLGESFCISSVSNPSAVVTAASDAFASLTGHSLSEIISRNCSFMQGPFTDHATVNRIRAGLREGREVAELILNYRRDEEPFWNLFTLFPLKDHQGKIWYWLGGQVDVSESVTSRRDLLRVLNRGHNPEAPTEANSAVGSTISSEVDVRGEKDDNSISRDGSIRSNSRSGFLQQFRKNQARSPSPPPTPTDRHCQKSGPIPRSTRLLAQEFLPRPRAPSISPVYAHYLVLACDQFAPSSIIQRQPTPTAGQPAPKKKQSLKLSIAFYSEAAAELLSLRGDVTRHGIFQVLEDHANSPSITRSFKAAVRERIEFGKSISAEIVIDRSRLAHFFGGGRRPGHHHRSVPGGSGGGGGGGSSANGGGSNGSGSRPGSSAEFVEHFRSGSGDKLDKLERMIPGRSKQEKLMSHWTPLKNANGDVEWVILVLAPRVAA